MSIALPVENVSDRVLVATILEHAPARYQDTLRAIPAKQKENYLALRRWIKDYCVSSRIYDDSGIAGGPVPMDVGQIKGDKSGKGKKGKGKDGKSNGKHVKGKVKSEKGSGNEKSGGNVQAPAQFQGYCGFCEKWGHKRADCRKRQREQGPSSTPSVKSASALPSSNSAGDAVAQVATLVYSGEQPKEKDDRWCFAMTTDANCRAVKGSVLIDSWSDEHVCRKEFAPAYETQPDPHPVTLRDVQKGVLQQYGVRDVSLQIGPSGITASQCAFKVADVNDDVLSLGRLLRRGFEFDLSLGRGCSMFPQGRPDKAVPLFLYNNSLRLQALPSVRAISNCRPVGMGVGVPAPTDPEVHAHGGERRDEVHGDRLLPVAALGPKSPLRALRAQLAELGRPTYGSKYHCWKRSRRAREARAESEAVARHEEAMAVGSADVQVPARPVEPLSEERERHNMSHLPPHPWCEHCVRGRAPEGDQKGVTFEQADKELPVIAFDLAFLKTSQGSERNAVADAYATQLVAVDVDSGMIRVIPAPGKNVSDYLVTELRKFVESTFHKKARLRCDNEPAAIIIGERLKALMPEIVLLENTP